VTDAAAWQKDRQLYDIGDIVAFEDQGAYVYLSGDCSKAYAPAKMEQWIRQIVFLRPNTFVIFDRVVSRDAAFKKTWLLQAMKRPEERGPQLVITNGAGRLFVQTLLPRQTDLQLRDGDQLYRYDGQSFPPERDTGPAPECRVEISPLQPSKEDLFLHVLTAASSATDAAPVASVEEVGDRVQVSVGQAAITFARDGSGGTISLGQDVRQLADRIADPAAGE
jgi:heparin/heparan-sulfate lyase